MDRDRANSGSTRGGAGAADPPRGGPAVGLSRSMGGVQPKTRALRPGDVDEVVRIQEGGTQAGDRPARMAEDIARTSASIIRIAGCRSDQVFARGRNHRAIHPCPDRDLGRRTVQGSYRELVNKAAECLSPYQEPTSICTGRTSNGSSRNRHSNADSYAAPVASPADPPPLHLHSSVNESRWLQPPAFSFLARLPPSRMATPLAAGK